MSGDELHLNGKLPPVVQYVNALSQLVEMQESGLEAVRLVHQEIVRLVDRLDHVVPNIFALPNDK